MDRVAGRIAVPVVARHSLRVAALDQLLDIGRQDPGEAHVPVPVLDLVPVMVLHILDAPLDLAGPTLRAVPFDSQSWTRDRKSTRLNSSHLGTSYAVFCLKKKNL